ncbi:MAG: CPXCG motif-containing cysteine-rich protein [Elusimicrobia bacterium]|nr:CPXCG motif-containing cysteine-rich protein [Elusimicrobiota bacterium]
MPKPRKSAATVAPTKKGGQATALEALKRLAGASSDHPAAALKRGKDKDESVDDPQLKRIFEDAAKTDVRGGSIKWLDVDCPHCGESFEVRVDSSQNAELTQECQSCTQSVTLAVEVDEGEVSVSAYQ